ncbi:hypothetical protein [Candidatus Sulfuricurvum sp. RIFRC-1]|uniref:hypothetical protein n=1 Tax=Candidatus Sulfuricurvum sp. RIFRC-1 TaxID=1249480 RepID=UPI0025B8B42D|nr:hypothetical protein [Candidatus Sulfuricurvum sp. RIFRC-1]
MSMLLGVLLSLTIAASVATLNSVSSSNFAVALINRRAICDNSCSKTVFISTTAKANLLSTKPTGTLGKTCGNPMLAIFPLVCIKPLGVI